MKRIDVKAEVMSAILEILSDNQWLADDVVLGKLDDRKFEWAKKERTSIVKTIDKKLKTVNKKRGVEHTPDYPDLFSNVS